METWLQKAHEMGFDVAVACDVATLMPTAQVREMCRADKCRAYGKNWTCPPHCGSISECGERIRRYQKAILLQTVGHMTKTIDSRCYRETERRHLESFQKLVKVLRRDYPDALCLGAGGCRICRQCAYPEPCRYPELAYASMEGYGLFVTQVCRDNGVPYYHGERTIAYSACVLFASKPVDSQKNGAIIKSSEVLMLDRA